MDKGCQVFISYSRPDFRLAKRIASELNVNGITCWVDSNSIQTGVSFAEEISSAIQEVADNAKLLLCIISQDTRSGGFLETEVRTAIRNGAQFILPVYVDHAKAPATLDFVLSSFQGINIDSNSIDLTKLVDTVQTILGKNAWVFVSHSNKDFRSIIRIRNKLESREYKPLLFFLKCLDDDTEIFELIKREIQARDRFILCDSQNARKSFWVQKEIEYIQSLNRPYEIVDIDATESEIDAALDRYDRRTTVYIWSTETCFNQIVARELANKSFRVSLLPIDFFESDAAKHPITNGYVLLLISRALSEKETDAISISAKRVCDYTYPIAISKEAFANGALFKELQAYDGIHTQFYLLKTDDSNNPAIRFFSSDAERAHSIVEDFLQLDSYVKNRTIKTPKI